MLKTCAEDCGKWIIRMVMSTKILEYNGDLLRKDIKHCLIQLLEFADLFFCHDLQSLQSVVQVYNSSDNLDQRLSQEVGFDCLPQGAERCQQCPKRCCKLLGKQKENQR